MSKPRRHHTVPRVYLANFVELDNRLTIFSKRRTKQLRPKPKDALVQSYYYSQPVDGVKNVDHTIESKLFGDLETPFPMFYDQLTNGKPVDLELMFKTVLMMRARSPAFREAYELGLAEFTHSFFKNIPANKLPKPPVSFSDIREHVHITIDPHRSLSAMRHYITVYCTCITDSSFVVARAPRGCEFLTSDNPVIWYEKGLEDTENAIYPNQMTSRTRIVLPLNKNLALIGRLRRENEPLFRLGVTQFSRTAIHEANRFQVACAWDYIVGTAKLPRQIWEKSIRVAPQMKIVEFDPEMDTFVLSETVIGPLRTKHKHAISSS